MVSFKASTAVNFLTFDPISLLVDLADDVVIVDIKNSIQPDQPYVNNAYTIYSGSFPAEYFGPLPLGSMTSIPGTVYSITHYTNVSGVNLEPTSQTLAWEVTGLTYSANKLHQFYVAEDVNGLITDIFKGHDNLEGSAFGDVLLGGAGNDTIDGKGGADKLYGGTGDDSYYVDDAGDQIFEIASEGFDTIYSSVSFAMPDEVEFFYLTGMGNIAATGNILANIIGGSDGDNVIDGRGGADTMSGGKGDDVYYVDDAGDIVVENTGEGTDTIFSTVSYSLAGRYVENLTVLKGKTLTGNSLGNILTGNDASNVLDGKAGVDRMIGGRGDDIYYVDHANDKVVEAVSQGNDTVLATVSYTLSADVENLTLQNSENINAVGNALANLLIGNDGNNALDGRGGADTMIGGKGNDIYYVDNAADNVVENADDGTDTIFSTASYSLAGRYVENLTVLSGKNVTGNSFANMLVGNDGSNVIDGKVGADTMIGGKGDDTYYVDHAGDNVVELNDGGYDSILSSVTYSLAGRYVEQLFLTGNAAIKATGNSFANVLKGNGGANVIDGGSGGDTIYGGLGADTLIGGAGRDTFVFDTALSSGNVDNILDFSSVDDQISLARSVFGNLNAGGTLAAAAFVKGSAAIDTDDRIIYNADNGKLYYDADGNDAGAMVQFAHIVPGTAISAGDFFII